MTTQEDQRLEGLKELAAIFAENYRRRIANGAKTEADILSFEPDPISDDVEVMIQLHDPECNGLYTETVKVENFLRNRKYRAKKLLMSQKHATK